MINFLVWYLVVTLVGWLTFPLAYRWLGGLPDRGYTFSRSMGVLLWGYLYWLLATLGIIPNQLGSIWLALALLAAAGGWMVYRLGGPERRGLAAWQAGWRELSGWIWAQRGLVLVLEGLFLLAFGVLAVVRAANPEIFGTEKPMEIAFINATLRSDFFPPRDPWLSGYAISYYYFGYVLIAMLAKFTGTLGSAAFNLGLALTFALTACGTYGMVFNLLNLAQRRMAVEAGPGSDDKPSLKHGLAALSGPFMVLLVSNIEGFLEVLHARGGLPATFWRWLDIQDINTPPAAPFAWEPRLFGTGSWWWWRASRVVQDYDFSGASREIIDEFPVFSYLLGDMHPHVLAMPFGFLAMALALNLLVGGADSRRPMLQGALNYRVLAGGSALLALLGVILLGNGLFGLSVVPALAGLVLLTGGFWIYLSLPAVVRRNGIAVLLRDDLGMAEFTIPVWIASHGWLLAILVLGGLAFLNTWDFPFYVALFALAYAARRLHLLGEKKIGEILRNLAVPGILIGVGGVVAYLPFYLSFSSQAGGILPNLIYPTRGAHLWVMFAVFLLPIFGYLFYLGGKPAHQGRVGSGFGLVGAAFLIMFVLALMLGIAILAIPGIAELFLSSLGAQPGDDVLGLAVSRRIVNLGGWLTLLCLAGLVIARLWPRVNAGESQSETDRPTYANSFALLLILMGSLLVIGPEFFFLRDQFGWRINTIFKFYFQAWLFWGVAAAYAVVYLSARLRGIFGRIFMGITLLVLGMGLVYTFFGMWDKTHGFKPPAGWTLDGAAHLERQSADEYAALRWLQAAPEGVIAEAVGGSYSPAGHGRVSAFSGMPAVLGWPGHESQWRGGSVEQGSRQADIQRLYCGRDWGEAQLILEQYQVRYVYVGPLERATYNQQTCGTGLSEDKFHRFMNQVFRLGEVTIYEVPWVDRLAEQTP